MLETAIGTVYISANSKGITSIDWRETESVFQTSNNNPHAQEALLALEGYFENKQSFPLPTLNIKGTPFQKKVWAEIFKIPFGEVRTYSDLAKTLGTHPRAIARGCASNPTALLIPCHRVVGKGGGLGGYSGGNGLDTKRALLAHEGIIL